VLIKKILNKIMRNIGKLYKPLIGGLISFATLDGYRRSVVNDIKNKKNEDLITNVINKYNEVNKTIQDKQDELIREQIATDAAVDRATESIKLVKQDTDNLINASKNNNKELIDATVKSIEKSSKNALNELNNILDIINSSSNKFINDYLNYLNNFLNSLNTTELGALSHIIVSVVIL
jgi:uncharacterized membrane protein YheB (UPF0754 family)